MPQTIKNEFGAVATELSTSDGLATICVDGVVSTVGVAALLGRCELDLRLSGASALVARYEAARIEISADSLALAAGHVMDGGAMLRMPTALVVRSDDVDMWRTYCDLQGRRGILRRAFVCENLARQWAAQHAALWEAQSKFRASLRSAR